jgi:SAM-dependent methyltransferase
VTSPAASVTRFRCPSCKAELGDFPPRTMRSFVCRGCGFEVEWRRDYWDACVDRTYPRDFARQWVLWESGRLGDPNLVYGTDPRSIFQSLLRFMSVSEEELRGRRILEVGYGHGRLLQQLQKCSDTAFGIDLVRPLKSAALRPGSAIFGNLFAIPFSPGQFDVVISRGVIQCTPNPGEALRCIAEQVAPDGILCIAGMYETGHKGSLRVRKLLPMSWRYPEWLRLRLASGLSLVRSLLEVLRTRSLSLSALRRHQAHFKLDIFDVISPRWSSQHSAEEVLEWFTAAGLSAHKAFPGVYVGIKTIQQRKLSEVA